jgi:hypothetical protein
VIAKNYGSVDPYRSQLEKAEGYGEVWIIVREIVKDFLGKSRAGMMLFLDDLPLHIGAYHPVGTNNIVLNKSLIEMAETTAKTKLEVNALVFTLLLHEYLHSLGYMSEVEVQLLVYKISKAFFGENHITYVLAKKGPRDLLNSARIDTLNTPKGTMEIVKDFEEPSQDYIV